ncbi:hypothetical protein [Nostoc sp.]
MATNGHTVKDPSLGLSRKKHPKARSLLNLHCPVKPIQPSF